MLASGETYVGCNDLSWQKKRKKEGGAARRGRAARASERADRADAPPPAGAGAPSVRPSVPPATSVIRVFGS